jgi:hypothetical protein
MGIFDFLKSNKNIITDNGTNYVYYDNGKGTIKEKFSKINGVLNGEYVEYNRNGIFKSKTYIDGVIPLTKEEISIKKREEEINNNIKAEINKLIIIDDLISEISGIFLLVQMENSKIDYYSNFIEEKYSNKFDEDYIKFYLYTKRNYFVNQLIENNINELMEICDSFNEIKYKDYFNKKFTDHILNYTDETFNINFSDIKVTFSESYLVKSNILSKLFVNFDVNSKLIINYNGIGVNKEIFNQHSVLFGLNFNTYRTIHEIIKKKSMDYKLDKNNIEFDNDVYNMLRVNENLNKKETQRKPTQQDLYAQKVVNKILTLCINNKVNQEDIILEL